MKQMKSWKQLLWGCLLALPLLLAACSLDGDDESILIKDPPMANHYDVEVSCAVDADNPAAVEADLEANPPIPAGCCYVLFSDSILIAKPNAEGYEIVSKGGISMKHGVKFEDFWTDAYAPLVPEEQIIGVDQWTFAFEDGSRYYDVIVTTTGHPLYTTAYLYEDLTAHYQQQFPEANVRSVARRQKLISKVTH